MRDYISRERLAEIAGDSCELGARQSLREVLAESPDELVRVDGPARPPFDVRTYRVRRDRWLAGEGPRAHGIQDFVTFLGTCTQSGRGVSVSGDVTTYVIVLDETGDEALAATAVDRPLQTTDEP